MSGNEQAPATARGGALGIRRARRGDLGNVRALDEQVTGLAKPAYWTDIFERYAQRRTQERFFLVAEALDDSTESPVLGYIVGEIRAWEFGSAPCGWVFAFAVQPETRQRGIGERLLGAILDEFRGAGVDVVRTMVPRENQLHMAFFRSEGMVAGPYIQLEMELAR